MTFLRLCWIVTACAASLCSCAFVVNFSMGSAVQQAAGFAGICAFVLIPYVFTRAIQGEERERMEEREAREKREAGNAPHP